MGHILISEMAQFCSVAFILIEDPSFSYKLNFDFKIERKYAF